MKLRVILIVILIVKLTILYPKDLIKMYATYNDHHTLRNIKNLHHFFAQIM